MLKVLFLLPNLTRGSAVRQVAALARGLMARRCEVRVCALRGGAGAEALRFSGVKPAVLSRGWLCDPRPYSGLIRAVRSFAPDVVHSWQGCEQPLLQSLIAWNSTASRIVSVDRPLPQFSPLFDRFLRPSKSASLQWIVPSPAVASGLSGASTTVIAPPTLPHRPTLRSPASLRQELGIRPEARVILGAGRLVPRNSWHDALWAMDILHFVEPHACLLVAGEGPERASLEAFVHANLLQDRIRFLGWRDDLAELVQLAEAIWLPTRIDAVPLVLLEAMALARPVIAARQPSIAAIVRDGETGLLFPAGDKPALARQTRWLLQHRAEARRIGASAQRLVQAHFTTEAWIERHLAIYSATTQQSHQALPGQKRHAA
jgi:glycosyltransferase involved in cell wall biosynthesis